MINQTTEYALRAVAFLATNDDAPVGRKQIAEATQVPNDYLTKVMQNLDRAGIVVSQRGRGGGYVLAVKANRLTVYDIVNAVAPMQRIKSCPLGIAGHVTLCPLHKHLDEAMALVEEAYRKTKLSDLVADKSATSCQFPRPLDDAS